MGILECAKNFKGNEEAGFEKEKLTKIRHRMFLKLVTGVDLSCPY